MLGEICREFRRILAPEGSLLVAFQAGVGKRLISRPYGHEVTLQAFLHNPADVAALVRAGFASVTQLVRPARPTETHPQGFVPAHDDATQVDSTPPATHAVPLALSC